MAMTAYNSPTNPTTEQVLEYGTPIGGSDSGRLKPVQTYKDILKQDVKMLQEDPTKLGMTEAQRRQMQSEAQQADAAQRQAQIQQLGQQALAGGAVSQGQLQQAAQTVAQQGGEAAAKTSADINKLNQRLIEQRKQQIWSDLDAARQRSREDARFWSQFGVDTALGIATAGTSVAAAAAAPATAPAA